MAIDPQELAKQQLADGSVPAPEDLLADLDPLAALYYLEQTGWMVLNMWTGFAQEQQDANADGAEDLAVTLSQVAAVVGMLDGACARIGLIPTDAVPPA